MLMLIVMSSFADDKDVVKETVSLSDIIDVVAIFSLTELQHDL